MKMLDTLAFWLQYSFMIQLLKIIVMLNDSVHSFERGVNI